MPGEPKRYLVTAALLYANGPVHIGHLAGCYLPADIYVRFLRQQGKEVVFVSGTDEHGIPVTLTAEQQKTTPKALVEKYHKLICQSFEDLNIKFDLFDRTSLPHHHKTASSFFSTLYQRRFFEIKETAQFFDEEKGMFLADRYVRGTCPACGYEEAYGDQCERCGRSLSPDELLAPRSIFGGKLSRRNTRHCHLPMQRWQKEMEAYIGSRTHWKSNVLGQCKSWLREGLKSRAMTRDLDWGVPVPLPDFENKVLYVWFDAPIGYISATQRLMPTSWKNYWQQEDTRLVHFIGKDNIVFHCLIFPLMLKLHGDYILPHDVPANEFLNLEGEKISTSRGWAVWLHEYVKDFPDHSDTLRYVLCANMPEKKDNNFSWRTFQAAHNNELVGILGNFVHRVMVLTQKYFDGQVPEAPNPLSEGSAHVYAMIEAATLEVSEHLSRFHFREALFSFMGLARVGNQYLTERAPWKKMANDRAHAAETLFVSLQLSAALCLLSEPFLPLTAQRWRCLLNLPSDLNRWSQLKTLPLLPEAQALGKPEHLFTPIGDEAIEAQLTKLRQRAA